MSTLDSNKQFCPFFEFIRGEIIHTTGVAEFVSIVKDGAIRRGLNNNPMGFCQTSIGLGKHLGPCLSLSDLSISSEDELLKGDNDWLDQVFNPWGGSHYEGFWYCKEYARVFVTMVFSREKLDDTKIYTPARIKKEFPDLVGHKETLIGGNFIYETEIGYAADIPTGAIKSILLVCDRSRKCFKIREWDVRNAEQHANYVLKLEKRLKNIFPPFTHLGPIKPVSL